MKRAGRIVLLVFLMCAAVAAFAQTPAPAEPKIDTGDTAWMLTSAALVLFMTIPGLFLFYGGLVRSKNVLGMLMQNFVMVGIITIQWIVIGYSLAFANGTSEFKAKTAAKMMNDVRVDIVVATQDVERKF